MRDVYIPDPPPQKPPVPRSLGEGGWPSRGQLVVMLIGWLMAGGVLGALLAVLRSG
jgi:hypothetical protein